MLKKIIIGILAGFVSGFFATGGGMILVPAFMYLLKMEPKKARATSITCILPIVVAASIIYGRNNYIDWNLGVKCALGGALGGAIGSKVLNKIPDYILNIVFTLFIIYIAFNMLGVC